MKAERSVQTHNVALRYIPVPGTKKAFEHGDRHVMRRNLLRRNRVVERSSAGYIKTTRTDENSWNTGRREYDPTNIKTLNRKSRGIVWGRVYRFVPEPAQATPKETRPLQPLK